MRRLHTRERWLMLAGLVSATLAVGVWLGDERAASPPTALVAASAAQSRAGAKPAPGAGAGNEAAPLLNFEKLKSRALGAPARDPFAAPAARGPKSRRAAPGAAVAPAPVVAPPPSAPVLPFTYMGKLLSGGDLAVFLIQGERNLVVHEGDTIDALYRVEHIAEGAITLVYLPLDQRQTLIIGEPQ